jgi:hypothetical protein
MSKPNAFWQLLESPARTGRPLSTWKLALREEFELVASYIVPTGALATTMPCARTFAGHFCSYRIVEHEDGTFAGVCDEGRCPRRVFQREELAQHAIDEDRLAKELTTLLGITPSPQEVEGVGRSRRLGFLKGEERIPVILTTQWTVPDCNRFLADFYADRSGRVLWIFSTGRRLDDKSQRILSKQEAVVFTIDGHFEIESGALKLLPEGVKDWDDTLFRLTGVGVHEHGFHVPAGAKWSDLTLRFRDGHTLVARMGKAANGCFSFRDLQMEDKRTKGPDVQWELLRQFAESYGTINWQSKAASLRNKKKKDRLAESLKTFFGIPGEPFNYLQNEGGWESVFNIQPE